MARKFKIGDKVKIAVSREESSKSGYSYRDSYRKGCVGTVSGYHHSVKYPYLIRMKKDNDTEIFKARELEKA